MTNEERVREFHEKFNIALGEKYTPDLIQLRMDLIEEEFEEFLAEVNTILFKTKEFKEVPQRDRARLLKELVDLLYVTYGFAVAFGLPVEKAMNEVHESNMSKLDDNGKPVYRQDGKVLKGPNYKPANLDNLV